MDTQTDVLAVSRREVKYLLSLPDRLYLLNALDQLLIPDAYGGYNGYLVRSVYLTASETKIFGRNRNMPTSKNAFGFASIIRMTKR